MTKTEDIISTRKERTTGRKMKKKLESSSVTKIKIILKLTIPGLDKSKKEDVQDEKELNQALFYLIATR